MAKDHVAACRTNANLGRRITERKKGENVFINTSFLSGFCSFVQSNWGSKGADAVGENVYFAMHGHELKGLCVTGVGGRILSDTLISVSEISLSYHDAYGS